MNIKTAMCIYTYGSFFLRNVWIKGIMYSVRAGHIILGRLYIDMKWTKITIETTTQATDMLSYVLSEYGVEGIEVEDKVPLSDEDKKSMFIDILPELPPDDGVAYVSCYINESISEGDQGDICRKGNDNIADTTSSDNQRHTDNTGIDIKDLCQYIKEQLDDMSSYMDVGTGRISIGETEDKDWMNNWKEFFHPFRLEDNIVIQPTWTGTADAGKDDIVIYIDPGTAFGTGSHETTKLCISALKQYISKDKEISVLDAGCGSGILSIIAAKMGASKIYGVDIDELAVEASVDNLKLNDIDNDIYKIVKGNIIDDADFSDKVEASGKYDIVVANILADVIIPLSAVVRRFMKPDGVFISSGIIDTKEDEVRTALIDNGFEIIDVNHMGEWVSFVAR